MGVKAKAGTLTILSGLKAQREESLITKYPYLLGVLVGLGTFVGLGSLVGLGSRVGRAGLVGRGGLVTCGGGFVGRGGLVGFDGGMGVLVPRGWVGARAVEVSPEPGTRVRGVAVSIK